jgi:hypothetical protein
MKKFIALALFFALGAAAQPKSRRSNRRRLRFARRPRDLHRSGQHHA